MLGCNAAAQYTLCMRALAAATAALFAWTSCASASTTLAPPLKLTAKSLALDAATAAREAALEPFVTQLNDALEETLNGKSANVAVKFATSPSGMLALMQWRLLTRIGAADRVTLAAQFPAEMAWLLSSRAPLELFLSSGEVQGERWNDATRVLCRIAAQDPSVMDAKNDGGLALRLAVATALVFAHPVKWMADGSEIDALARYESYLAWDREGVLFESFRDLSAWELRYVVGSWSSDADLVWARANIKPELKVREKVGDGAHMLAYNGANKSGVSVQEGAKFYDNKPMTLAIMLEYGGVCGAISRFGTSMAQAFGVPAMPVGQPGHCAFIWQKTPHAWSINNDISGWAESGCHGGITIPWGHPAYFVPLMQLAQSEPAHFAESEVLRSCAELVGEGAKDAVLAKATDACGANFAAWQERIAAMNAMGVSTSATEWKSAFKKAANALHAQPRAYASLLAAAEKQFLADKPTVKARAEFACDAASVLADMARAGADGTLLSWALRDVLVQQAEALAKQSESDAKSAKTLESAVKAARALVTGDDAHDAVLSEGLAIRVIEMTLRAANAFDLAPSGSAHDVWTRSLRSAISGMSWQPSIREAGLRRVQTGIETLMASKRDADARWFADRIVESAKATKDAEFEAKAVAFRASLG